MTGSLHMSLLSLDPVTSRAARRCLTDTHALHRLVMSGFPDTDAPGARSRMGVLFRVDAGEHRTQVLVQSVAVPTWDGVEPGILAAPARTRDASPLLSLPDGSRLRFRLVANPTRAIRPDGRTSRHAQQVPLRRDDARIGWLLRNAERGGFAIDSDALVVSSMPLMRGKRNGDAIAVEPCRFDGLLRVADPDAFARTLTGGIGRSRAFGCGLLTVARP